MADIDINKLTEEQLRALKDRIAALPQGKPPGPVAPYDPLDRICSPAGQWQWARDLVRANREAGIDAAMRAEMADRYRPPAPPVSRPAPAPTSGGSGWAPAIPLGPPPGVREVDRLCDAADAIDRRERISRMSREELQAGIDRREVKGD
jgi:hypothetical protein